MVGQQSGQRGQQIGAGQMGPMMVPRHYVQGYNKAQTRWAGNHVVAHRFCSFTPIFNCNTTCRHRSEPDVVAAVSSLSASRHHPISTREQSRSYKIHSAGATHELLHMTHSSDSHSQHCNVSHTTSADSQYHCTDEHRPVGVQNR